MMRSYPRTSDRPADVDTFLAEVLVTAIEGGISYWSSVDFYAWNFDGEATGELPPAPSNGGNAYARIEVLPEYVDPEGGLAASYELTLDTVALGLQRAVESGGNAGRGLAAALEPHPAKDDLTDLDVDANTADAIIQFALFGTQVFG